MTNISTVTIYTDGACVPNPGRGGYGAVFLFPSHAMLLSGGHPDTTNNRMEMFAAIAALRALPSRHTVKVFSDSKYVVDGMTSWIHGWKRRDWKVKSKGKAEVKNLDLWKELDSHSSSHNITWHWVRGHSGDFHNEKADELSFDGLKQQIEICSHAPYPLSGLRITRQTHRGYGSLGTP